MAEFIAFYAHWATLALILAVPFTLWRQLPSRWTVLGCGLYVLSYFLANSWQVALWVAEDGHGYGLALRMYTLSGLVMVTVYLGVVYFLLTRERLPKPDLQAKLVWLVLLMAEGYAVLEYAGCKLWDDPFGDGDLRLKQEWGIEVSRYACGRSLGLVAPYVAPITTTVFLLWINIRGAVSRWKAAGKPGRS